MPAPRKGPLLFPNSAGTRLLVRVLVPLLVHQPPLAVLAQQALVVLFAAANPAYCCCRLLADPLTERRMLRLWRALQFTSYIDPLSRMLPPEKLAIGGQLRGRQRGGAWP